MEFKKLELEPESNWFKRTIKSKHTKRTVLFTLLGALAGFLIFIFGEGKNLDHIQANDIINSLLIGGFFGFFITNSPCARNKC